MTIARVRNIGQVNELAVATDSRLRAGYAWDACPKIMKLPRSDAVLAFAGETDYAYPMMLQIYNAVDMYERSRSRTQDITKTTQHLERVCNEMISHIGDPPSAGVASPELVLVLAGFSWQRQEFVVKVLNYSHREERFSFTNVRGWEGKGQEKTIVFLGNRTTEAKERLRAYLDEEGRLITGGLNMEPFKVLRDMSRDTTITEIGGPPQLVKVYRSSTVQHFAVAWPTDDGRLCTFGRPLLSYEPPECPVVRPDTLRPQEREQDDVLDDDVEVSP